MPPKESKFNIMCDYEHITKLVHRYMRNKGIMKNEGHPVLSAWFVGISSAF
jgi:hypothetical protein